MKQPSIVQRYLLSGRWRHAVMRQPLLCIPRLSIRTILGDRIKTITVQSKPKLLTSGLPPWDNVEAMSTRFVHHAVKFMTTQLSVCGEVELCRRTTFFTYWKAWFSTNPQKKRVNHAVYYFYLTSAISCNDCISFFPESLVFLLISKEKDDVISFWRVWRVSAVFLLLRLFKKYIIVVDLKIVC